jgi:hypothetical protein
MLPSVIGPRSSAKPPTQKKLSDFGRRSKTNDRRLIFFEDKVERAAGLSPA